MPRSVLNDRFFESFSSSVLDFAQAESLPPACYVDPEFFEFEKETLFYKEWLCVGRESWVKEPGDYFCSKHVGEPLVITRTKSGEVAAMSAVCQHRGMLVAEGRGHARGLVCPYHHWFYSLTGELVAAPEMDRTCNFEKSNHNLARLKVEIWQGFVFVNFDAGALPLTPRLRALDDVVANYDLANLDGPPAPEPNRYNWNWKVMFENNNDGYHANRLHHGPLHDPVPSSLACFPELPDESAGYYRTNGSLHPDASFNPTLKALLPVFPKLTDAERNRVVFVNVPPTLSLVMNTDLVLYLIIQAEDADHHSMFMGSLVEPDAMKNPMFDRLMKFNQEAVQDIVSQDLHVDELVQQGLKSKFAPRGRYSWQEGAQRQLNVWLVDRYRRGWEGLKAEHSLPSIRSKPRVAT
ncbi:MAG: aromatic ring-hydroxylating dioxygenase subunit alpha [Rhizomicrobium sp.]|jgi:phenylpropionate dioxygenase-like ring-hydroxylating dioxygenase large terminal subunit